MDSFDDLLKRATRIHRALSDSDPGELEDILLLCPHAMAILQHGGKMEAGAMLVGVPILLCDDCRCDFLRRMNFKEHGDE